MTEVQFFFNLDIGKQIVVETDEGLIFFEQSDPEIAEEHPYTGVMQDGNDVTYFGFTKEKLEQMVRDNESILEYSSVQEVITVKKWSLQHLYYKFLNWLYGR